ncbi:MAG: hypothetical protein ABUL60_11960 [Myxococcales bacterium]
MSEEESARMEAVGRHYSINGAAVIRMLLKKEHRRLLEVELQPEDFELLRTLPADGAAMSRPHLEKALKGDQLPRSVAWLGPSVSRLMRHDLISRDGKNFALTTSGRALID